MQEIENRDHTVCSAHFSNRKASASMYTVIHKTPLQCFTARRNAGIAMSVCLSVCLSHAGIV